MEQEKPHSAFNFLLGAPHAHWLALLDVPLFVSRATLARRKSLPRAAMPWALDSGGFTQLSLFGKWTIPPRQYVTEVRRFAEEVGSLRWAAVQDWMCEPWLLQKTGFSVEEHQGRTVDSFLRLRDMAPALPWLPVLQGWEHRDYFRHLEEYVRAGVDLSALPLVGLGSVCRRQHTGGAQWLIRQLASDFGLRLHGFGFKTLGLRSVSDVLVSADSMAWSLAARWGEPLPGCVGRHKKCVSCPHYALLWHERMPRTLAVPRQGELFGLQTSEPYEKKNTRHRCQPLDGNSASSR